MSVGKLSPSCVITQPMSLLEHCKTLVAGHLDLVESFHGLPSLIGEQIFRVSCNMDRIWTDFQYSTTAVNLFAAAYGEEFLSKLNLSGEHLGLNYCLEQILIFTDLVELDVSECGLGDEHEIISHVDNLTRLEVLSLRDNVLSNVGIQKMTTPYRMFNRGPSQLKILDLTGNAAISKDCLKYLTKFKQLKMVMFTESDNRKLQTHGCWRLSSTGYHRPPIVTRGWASVLIDRWMNDAKHKSRSRPDKPKPATGLFSIRKHHDMDMIEQHFTQASRPLINPGGCHIVVSVRVDTVPDDKPTVSRCIPGKNDKVKDSHDSISDIDEIQNLYKTVEPPLIHLNMVSNNCSVNYQEKQLSNTSKKTKLKVLNHPSLMKNKIPILEPSGKSKLLITKQKQTSIINHFSSRPSSDSDRILTYAGNEKSAEHTAGVVQERNSLCKENSCVQQTASNRSDKTSVQPRARKRKKIVIIKNVDSVCESIDSRPDTMCDETNLSTCQSEPTAKKQCLKPSVFDSLNKYM